MRRLRSGSMPSETSHLREQIKMVIHILIKKKQWSFGIILTDRPGLLLPERSPLPLTGSLISKKKKKMGG